jgi:hypothetical protein
MRIFLRCCAALLLGCIAQVPLSEAAPAETPSVKLEVVTREERISVEPTSKTLLLRNPHGDVRLRITDQPMVGIHATIQRIGETPLEPTFDIRQHDGVFELSIRYPDEQALLAAQDHGYGRVDLGVWVPANLALDLMTADGLLQVKRARSSVRARTTSGALQVTAGAEIDLASDSGDIAFSQYSGQWTTPARVRSNGGHVYASIPAFADIELSVRAGGRIESPQGLPQPAAAADHGMRLHASFGTAQRELHIESAKGDVYLYPVVPGSAISATDDKAPR